MSTTDPAAPTQVAQPWRASIRTGVQAFVAFAAIAALAAPELSSFVEQFWPGSPVVAWIAAGAAFVGAVSLLITRLMAIPGVDAFLTTIGLGAKSK